MIGFWCASRVTSVSVATEPATSGRSAPTSAASAGASQSSTATEYESCAPIAWCAASGVRTLTTYWPARGVWYSTVYVPSPLSVTRGSTVTGPATRTLKRRPPLCSGWRLASRVRTTKRAVRPATALTRPSPSTSRLGRREDARERVGARRVAARDGDGERRARHDAARRLVLDRDDVRDGDVRRKLQRVRAVAVVAQRHAERLAERRIGALDARHDARHEALAAARHRQAGAVDRNHADRAELADGDALDVVKRKRSPQRQTRLRRRSGARRRPSASAPRRR
jgi:hypothetical protein